MFCTQDFAIERLFNLRNGTPVARVGVEVQEGAARAVQTAYEAGISTRSRLARCFAWFHVFPEASPYYSRGRLKDVLGYESHFPVVYEVGDKVGRFYALEQADLVRGSELNRLAQGFKGKKDGNRVFVDIQDSHFHPRKVTEPVRARIILENPAGFMEACENPSHTSFIMQSIQGRRSNTVLQTVPIAVPEGYFAFIRGTTWAGTTEHLPSTVIDPGFKGPVIVEVDNLGDASGEAGIFPGEPKLILEVYRATEPRA